MASQYLDQNLCDKCQEVHGRFLQLFHHELGRVRSLSIGTLAHMRETDDVCCFCRFIMEAYELGYELEPGQDDPKVSGDEEFVLRIDKRPETGEEIEEGKEGEVDIGELWYERAGVSAQIPPAPALWLQLSTATEVDEPLVLISCVPRDAKGSEWFMQRMYAMPRKRNISVVQSGLVDYEVVHNWLTICNEQHADSCGTPKTYQRQTLKIHLVDVWTREIKRVDTDEPYVALSYVWGSGTHEKYLPGLKPGLMVNRNHPVPLPQKLPQTIEDAMTFTHSINVRYLWVDILCINQFDLDEKRAQIEQMHLVYQCAYLTIIGLDGTDIDSGLAGVSRPMVQIQQPVVETLFGKFMATFVHAVWNHQGNSPWDKRAWTLQELVLSRRIIILDYRHMMFQCDNELFNEVMTVDVKVDRVPNRLGSTYFWDNGMEIGLNTDVWNFLGFDTLVSNYTRRQLSDENDVLAACTGALNQITRYTGIGFAYGMPRSDMHLALMWKARDDVTVTRRSGFPTWSWAGWRGPTENHYCIDDYAMYKDMLRVEGRKSRRSGEVRIDIAQELQVKRNRFAFIDLEPKTDGMDSSGVVQLSSSIARFKLKMVRSSGVEVPRSRDDSRLRRYSVGDQWLLIKQDGVPLRNLHGGSTLFEEVDYSFQVHEEISSQLATDLFKCEAIFVRHFEWLRDSKGCRNWLDDMVGVLIIRRVDANRAERIGSMFITLEEWVSANPRPGVIHLI